MAEKLPPSPLPLTREEADFYRSIGATALKTRKFTDADRFALALLAQQMALSVRLRKALAASELITETGRGSMKADPRVAQLEKTVDQCTRLLVQFGLTPASRNRATHAAPPPAQDALAEFVNE